jgi:CRISPR-associated protein Cas2
MYVCIAYDISSNRLRLKVSKYCKKIGLQRLQKSMFWGETRKEMVAELEKDIRPLLSPRSDQLAIIPLDSNVFKEIAQKSGIEVLQNQLQSFLFHQH